MVWPWMTLRCHFTLKSAFIVGLARLAFGDNYAKMNKNTPTYRQRQKKFTGESSFRQYKAYADIR